MCSSANGHVRQVTPPTLRLKLGYFLSIVRQWPPATWIAVAVVLCAMEFLEFLDLTVALVGAGGYMLLQYLNGAKPLRPKAHTRSNGQLREDVRQSKVQTTTHPWRAATTPQVPRQLVAAPAPLIRQPSSVRAPTFVGIGWDAEVQELVCQLAVTPECEEAVKNLAHDVERVVKRMIATAEVAGFTFGNPASSKAFGVAVPDIDIVVTASDEALLKWWRGSYPKASGGSDVHKACKAAVRACTDQLVSSCDFRFRRSAFRDDEPKVILLAPVFLGGCAASVPTNVYVNATTPLRSWTLLSDCGRFDVRARELVLLVRRWARDRGVSHVAKGHMSPYAWSMLAIFFLQATNDDNIKLLPPTSAFPKFSRLALGVKRAQKSAVQAKASASSKTTAELYKEFFGFYAKEFDWKNETVSVLQGLRTTAEASAHRRTLWADGASEVLPCVVDPFEPAKNLGAGMTCDSVARLREELHRANELCAREASLGELLEPWAPPEWEDADDREGRANRDVAVTRASALMPRGVGSKVEAARPGSLTSLPQLLAPRVGAKVQATQRESLTSLPEVLAPRVSRKVS